jgi:hypothetical protein
MAKPEATEDRVVCLSVGYHGDTYAVTAHGRIFHRIPDPAPATRPGPVGFVWHEIEGPKL